MSVPVSQRRAGKLEALTKAELVARHSINCVCNDKVFSGRYKDYFADPIAKLATEIYLSTDKANRIVANTPEKAKQRLALQQEAILKCDSLLVMLQLAQRTIKFRARRLEYWGTLIMDCQDMLRRWHASDKRRYE